MALALVSAAVLAPLLAGEWLSRPVRRTIGPPPAALGGDAIQIPRTKAAPIAGWAADGKTGGGAVLLLHGVRSDRRQMLARALWLHRAGYAVLLVDLPAHGESAGDRITFGARESDGVTAALAYMASRWPGERIGIVGVSLGAASTVLAPALPGVRAVVLESMYPTIEDALHNRLRRVLGDPGAALAPALLWQLPLRTGVSTNDLRPIDRIARLPAPVLLLNGTRDRHTPPDEARRLQAAAGPAAALWLVDGAAHFDLHRFAPAAYEACVGAFLQAHLRAPGLEGHS